MGDHFAGPASGSKGGKPVILAQNCTGDYKRGLVVGSKGGRPVVAWGECQNSLATGGHKVGTVVGSKGGRPVVAIGCRSCSCSTKIKVTGCGPPAKNQAGATVTIGASSGVTDSNGEVTLSIPGAGSYTVQVTAAGFADFSGVRTLACNGTTTISLTLASGYHCTGCCPRPLPDVLFLSTPLGAVQLDWFPGSDAWGGCQLLDEGAVCGGTAGTGGGGEPCTGRAAMLWRFSSNCGLLAGFENSAGFCGPLPPGAPCGWGTYCNDCSLLDLYMPSPGAAFWHDPGFPGTAAVITCDPFSWTLVDPRPPETRQCWQGTFVVTE